ncbi:hypothetical protein F5878DRAFT_388173 [Lentinula raphanica]|uniref:Uncharacterized protein n=1 Tax=Lentinula raphanica TaxID=153919 RepID=A0AA38P010_9AGAR|nr:hypothetical protein F5878DRAFT_388173 [Lentinula raphanica]
MDRGVGECLFWSWFDSSKDRHPRTLWSNEFRSMRPGSSSFLRARQSPPLLSGKRGLAVSSSHQVRSTGVGLVQVFHGGCLCIGLESGIQIIEQPSNTSLTKRPTSETFKAEELEAKAAHLKTSQSIYSPTDVHTKKKSLADSMVFVVPLILCQLQEATRSVTLSEVSL